MSVFQVKLNNASQGTLDVQASTSVAGGTQIVTSKQRTVYVMGPRKINRELKDGDIFTDCNYWKRFCSDTDRYAGTATDETAIVTCLTDDGTVYSDDASENSYPYAKSLSCTSLSTYADTYIDIVAATGTTAKFVTITNHAATAVNVKLNGLTNAIFTLAAGASIVFNHGDLQVSMVGVQPGTASGFATANVDVVCGIASPINS